MIFSLLLAASWFVFVRARSAPGSFPALFYVPFPLLAAAAVRLGPWGASTSVMACALVAIWGAVQGLGPFVASSPAENALTIQLFLIIASASAMSLAALTEDRARAESKARRSEEQLAIALDAAQLGRWDWDIAQQRLEWSDITRRMYGVPLDGPVSIETFAALIHPGRSPRDRGGDTTTVWPGALSTSSSASSCRTARSSGSCRGARRSSTPRAEPRGWSGSRWTSRRASRRNCS